MFDGFEVEVLKVEVDKVDDKRKPTRFRRRALVVNNGLCQRPRADSKNSDSMTRPRTGKIYDYRQSFQNYKTL